MTFDFRALGENGQPVPDLAEADLALRIDGRVRQVRSLRFVRAASGASNPVPAPFGSNALGESGRAIVLVIEDESLRAGVGRYAIDGAIRFIRTLSPADRVALITMPRGGLHVDLTNDHAAVIAALSRIFGQASSRATTSDSACRTRLTLQALATLFESLASAPMPKTVVFMSAGLLRAT